ncbi:hypothetical protein [Streptomyces sp. NPDC048638]|uniref:hypothetical protein n=1 Tax=Streptomyces sp. NPDC048638 TaxID=3365580 RepID=UPI003714C197
MASHARPKAGRITRTLLRTGLAVSAAGAALAAGGSGASAAPAPAPAAVPDGGAAAPARGLAGDLGSSARGAAKGIENVRLNPLADTSVDPLNNAVETRVADFKPLSTTLLTGPLSHGGTLKDLTKARPTARGLHG